MHLHIYNNTRVSAPNIHIENILDIAR